MRSSIKPESLYKINLADSKLYSISKGVFRHRGSNLSSITISECNTVKRKVNILRVICCRSNMPDVIYKIGVKITELT